MKVRKIESLKKNVLLVDGLPEKEIEDFFENEKVVASNFNFDGVIGNWNLLGKLKDLTDKDCESLVDTIEGTSKDYVGGMFIFTAKESFLSALEAEINHELFSDNSIIFVEYGS